MLTTPPSAAAAAAAAAGVGSGLWGLPQEHVCAPGHHHSSRLRQGHTLRVQVRCRGLLHENLEVLYISLPQAVVASSAL
jgi:hypothetical protein